MARVARPSAGTGPTGEPATICRRARTSRRAREARTATLPDRATTAPTTEVNVGKEAPRLDRHSDAVRPQAGPDREAPLRGERPAPQRGQDPRRQGASGSPQPASPTRREQALLEALSALDRAAKAGAIHPNQAARRKSRLTLKINAALGGEQVQAAAKVTKSTGAARRREGRQGPHRGRQGRQGQGRPDGRRQGPRGAVEDRSRRGRRGRRQGDVEAAGRPKAAAKAPARAKARRRKAPAKARAKAAGQGAAKAAPKAEQARHGRDAGQGRRPKADRGEGRSEGDPRQPRLTHPDAPVRPGRSDVGADGRGARARTRRCTARAASTVSACAVWPVTPSGGRRQAPGPRPPQASGSARVERA